MKNICTLLLLALGLIFAQPYNITHAAQPAKNTTKKQASSNKKAKATTGAKNKKSQGSAGSKSSNKKTGKKTSNKKQNSKKKNQNTAKKTVKPSTPKAEAPEAKPQIIQLPTGGTLTTPAGWVPEITEYISDGENYYILTLVKAGKGGSPLAVAYVKINSTENRVNAYNISKLDQLQSRRLATALHEQIWLDYAENMHANDPDATLKPNPDPIFSMHNGFLVLRTSALETMGNKKQMHELEIYYAPYYTLEASVIYPIHHDPEAGNELAQECRRIIDLLVVEGPETNTQAEQPPGPN